MIGGASKHSHDDACFLRQAGYNHRLNDCVNCGSGPEEHFAPELFCTYQMIPGDRPERYESMILRKIADSPEPCRDREHLPPSMISLSPGLWEHTCPGCGKKIIFYISGKFLELKPNMHRSILPVRLPRKNEVWI